MHDFLACDTFTAGSCHFLQHDLPMSWLSQMCTTFLSPHAFDIARADGSFAILWLDNPNRRTQWAVNDFLWSMVRFDSNTPSKAAHIHVTALARCVCCTGRRSQRTARRVRVEIAINILHVDVAK